MKSTLPILFLLITSVSMAVEYGVTYDRSNCTITKDGRTYQFQGKVRIVDYNGSDVICVRLVDYSGSGVVEIKLSDFASDSCDRVKVVDYNGSDVLKVRLVDYNGSDVIRVRIVK